MEKKAIEHALRKLDAADRAAAVLPHCRTFDDFLHHWSAFLVGLNGVFFKLQNGAARNAKSKEWFDEKRTEREGDELLRYLHEARNVDEHGLGELAAVEPGSLNFSAKPGQGSFHIQSLRMIPGQPLEIRTDRPEALQITLQPDRFILVPVERRRDKLVLQPPEQHLGKRILSPLPVTVAKLALNYSRSLINEASELSSLR